MQVWEIDGEDLIVANSWPDARLVFADYHGVSIRGHDRRLVPDDEVQTLTDGCDEFSMTAKEFATMRGRGCFPAYK